MSEPKDAIRQKAEKVAGQGYCACLTRLIAESGHYCPAADIIERALREVEAQAVKEREAARLQGYVQGCQEIEQKIVAPLRAEIERLNNIVMEMSGFCPLCPTAWTEQVPTTRDEFLALRKANEERMAEHVLGCAKKLTDRLAVAEAEIERSKAGHESADKPEEV